MIGSQDLFCRVAMLLNAALRALPKMAMVNCLLIGDDFWLSRSIVQPLLIFSKYSWTTFSIRSGDNSSQMSPTDIRRRPSSVSINCAMPGLQVWALKNGPHFQEQSFYDLPFLQDQRRSAPDLALLPASVELQVESSSSARPSILKVGIAFKRFPIPSRCVQQTFVLNFHCFP